MTLPPATQKKLLTEHPFGTRHKAKIDIAMSMIGEGIPPAAVAVTLREKFPQASEKEIEGAVSFAIGKNPTPSGYGDRQPLSYAKPAKTLPASPQEAVARFVNGNAMPLNSPVQIGDSPTAQLFRALYEPDEYLNLLSKYVTSEKDGEIKANPIGAGKNLLREEWIAYFAANGIPTGNAGAWMRPNPVKHTGSGSEGAITDADITARRFLLLESDEIAPDAQLAFYQNLRIPIAAIITSGGKSCHAWLRMDCTAEEYSARAGRIFEILAPFGIDKANKNASRLSRLVGAVRKIGAKGDGQQQLLYLDPSAEGITDEQITAMELRLRPKKFHAKPMRQAIAEAIDFYEDIRENKFKTGLRTGFNRFDSITGGLKRGWLTVVAGETNAGKTSYVLNIVMNVLTAGKSVALFSFEMDQQEIIDIIFSRQASVNRNKFNNGYFSEHDFEEMARAQPKMQEYKLHIFDDPSMTIADVMEVCQQLALEGEIDLVVIDYIQLANVEAYQNSREQQVAYISRQSKGLAKKIKAPVIAVSQLNEDGKVRESRGISHDANCLIKLIEQDSGDIEAKVIKGRSIPKGSYFFHFNREECEFIEKGCDEKLEKMIPPEPKHSYADQ